MPTYPNDETTIIEPGIYETKNNPGCTILVSFDDNDLWYGTCLDIAHPVAGKIFKGMQGLSREVMLNWMNNRGYKLIKSFALLNYELKSNEV